MTSVKVKFRASSVGDKSGSLYFQVIHNRIVRQVKTDYKLYADEWDAEKETVITNGERERQLLLCSIKERLEWDLARWNRVINTLESQIRRYSADEVIMTFKQMTKDVSLFSFMYGTIALLWQLGRERTSETYTATLKSFMSFRNNQDVPLDGINDKLILLYEAWLKSRGVCMNTVSFYMRILRAVYNRAVEKELTPQRYPFRHVYTGIDKTVKRAVSIKVIKSLKKLDLSSQPSLDFARDMFLFSFYTRGMSFVDMAHLRGTDLCNGFLTYRRRKTGQRLTIRWEKCMDEVVKKHAIRGTDYLLPIIKHTGDERKQYTNNLHHVNNCLKKISHLLNLSRPLTMYVARHSWASVAKSQKVPLSVISEGMGHDSEVTTQIYLASLETSVVDKANKMILGLL